MTRQRSREWGAARAPPSVLDDVEALLPQLGEVVQHRLQDLGRVPLPLRQLRDDARRIWLERALASLTSREIDTFTALCRIDTANEIEYFMNGRKGYARFRAEWHKKKPPRQYGSGA